uniref:DUF4371 domain-containing protein n=1 Tax=Fundulus heteroclitus TaxID=8078 RepID=A0A3Q2NMW6_FUNHE
MADTLKKVPLSNNTVSRRINMSLNITGQFALQLDEMTDVRGDAQLLGFVRFKDTTGEELFQVIDTCSHVCTDGVAAMTGTVKGLFGHIEKRVSPDLSAVMDDAVKMINFIQSLPLNHRLKLFVMRAAHSTNSYVMKNICILLLWCLWVARLAYLTDMFVKASHILKMYDKIKGFTKKLKLWDIKSDEGDVSCSPLLDARLSTADFSRGPVVRLVQAHLSSLSTDSSQYFQDIEESERLDWVSDSSNSLPARLQEHLMDLSSDRGLKMTFAESTLTDIWYDEKEYPELGKHRNRLDVENSLVTAVSSLPPDLSGLIRDKQAQVIKYCMHIKDAA